MFIYYFNWNYRKIEISTLKANQNVAIIDEDGRLEHMEFLGEIDIDEAKGRVESGEGRLAKYFGSPGFKFSSNESWEFVCHPDVLLAYDTGNRECFVVLKAGLPYICKAGDPIYEELSRLEAEQKNPQSNVITFPSR